MSRGGVGPKSDVQGGVGPKSDVQGGRSQIWCPRGVGPKSDVQGGSSGVAYHVTYPIMHLILPTPPREQTDACENNTFQQFRFAGGKYNFQLLNAHKVLCQTC